MNPKHKVIYIDMETSGESSLSAREVDSLSEFTRNILQNVNTSCSDDRWSTLDPESDKTQGQSYGDDQFEGIFYRTVTEETEIFVSNVFCSVFKNKINADFFGEY